MNRQSEAIPPFVNRHSTFDIRHSNVVSHERCLWPQKGQSDQKEKL
ncbi:hypothetical protein D1AOALGA4SA_5073 [Olavius algarvensis Delta 1 endosymbiont]|nr:hypothetical protein D1AOALGA4SA_5073 [Olavius algarvensis Delta 1 endosymbiont]